MIKKLRIFYKEDSYYFEVKSNDIVDLERGVSEYDSGIVKDTDGSIMVELRAQGELKDRALYVNNCYEPHIVKDSTESVCIIFTEKGVDDER